MRNIYALYAKSGEKTGLKSMENRQFYRTDIENVGKVIFHSARNCHTQCVSAPHSITPNHIRLKMAREGNRERLSLLKLSLSA